MTFEIPYNKRPEDVTKLLQILPAAKMPADKVDVIYLKSLGFSDSSSKHLFDILKMLGFIGDNDKPSATWLAYVADEKRGLILASAIKKAYPDLFKFILCPYLEDDQVILDFFRRNVKASSREMELILQTFRSLAGPADFQDILCQEGLNEPVQSAKEEAPLNVKVNPNLQINVQVHIDPNTPDEKIETIFKNMRKYLLGKEG